MRERIVGIIPHKSNNLELNNQATKIFTVAGVDITTNLDEVSSINITSKPISDFYTLSDSILELRTLTTEEPVEISTNPREPKTYARYGSFREQIRVALDTILLKYPAAIYSAPLNDYNKNNINSIAYNPFTNETELRLNVSYFRNPFDIYYLNNLNFRYSDERVSELRLLNINFDKYYFEIEGQTYDIIDFEGSTRESNDILYLKVSGQAIPNLQTSVEFYIRPKDEYYGKFYQDSNDLEGYLLNIENEFNAIFNSTTQVDGGIVINTKLSFQFPKVDLYNLDIKTNIYETYISDLVTFADNYDDTQGNILSRKYVPDNVLSVTLDNEDALFPQVAKINQMVEVFGFGFDTINVYIDSLKLFNSITYDKRDNIAEALIPDYAKMLGWDVANEANIDDFYRLLILNSAQLWKSKGTRSAIDFVFKFFAIPEEIIEFNEYIFKANKPVDRDKLNFYYSLIDGDFDINTLPIDEEGYPKIIPNSEFYYFQQNGNSDDGLSYFNPFLNLLPIQFTGANYTYEFEEVNTKNIVQQDYNLSGDTINYNVVNSNLDDNSCFSFSGNTTIDPMPEVILDVCDCPLPISDNVFKFHVAPSNFTGCNTVIVDTYYNCTTEDSANLFVNILGGNPPYILSGLSEEIITNGVLSGYTISTGEYKIVAIDSKGCTSDVNNFNVVCVDPCLSSDLDVLVSYSCIKDEFNLNTGKAIITINASGGIPPYTITGGETGDIVNDGQVVSITVKDSVGCVINKGLTIDCPKPAEFDCDPISLEASLETVNSELSLNTAKVNATYDITDLPLGAFVSGVTMQIVGVGGDNLFVVGTPISTDFTTSSGVDTVSLNFNPSEVQTSITLQITIDVTLNNGCTYNDQYTLTVNPRVLADVDTYNTILNN